MNIKKSARIVGLFVSAFAILAACTSTPPAKEAAVQPRAAASAAPVAMPTVADSKAQNYAGLHNVVAYTPELLSGSVPEGEEGFATLQAMGIRTIISVDGAQPNLEEAKKYGLRYVHLPIGYDGFDDTRRLELARAVRDLPGPMYLHCHHGKHRSAGAAGAVAVTLGQTDTEFAVSRMKVSGTSPDYKGLYLCVNQATPATDAQVSQASGAFPELYKTSDFVQTMVEIDEAAEHLKAIEAAGWTVPKDHPDLVPAALAGLLADHLRVSAELPESKSATKDYLALLAKSAAAAQKVEDLIVDPKATNAERSAAFKALNATCKECHTKHRD